MEIYFDEENEAKKKRRLFYMRHGNHEPIMWDCKDISIEKDTFRDINGYWKFLSEEQQEEIFIYYQEIRATIDNGLELNSMFIAINRTVQNLYKLHPLSLIEHWVKHYSDIRFPDNLKTELSEDDRKEQTYLEGDYKALVVFSVALKVVLPAWGEYIALDSALSEMNREQFALQLLQRTDIINSPEMNRFREFVDSVVENQPVGMKGILDGVGTLAMPEWIFSVLVVKKLSSIMLPHKDDSDRSITPNLIAQMWKEVRALAPTDKFRSSKNDVRSKILPNDAASASDEDNLSTAESYKAKEGISDGERITFDFAGRELVSRFLPKLITTQEMTDLFYRQLKRNQSRTQFNPTETQIKLAELVVHKYFILRSTVHSNRESAINVITVAQVTLHSRGFSTLADLLGARQMAQVHSISANNNLTKDQIEILDELYSYRRNMPLRNSKSKTVLVNPGIIAIEELFSRFSQYHWETNSDDEIKASSELVKVSSGFVIPYNLKDILVNFIIDLRTNTENSERFY